MARSSSSLLDAMQAGQHYAKAQEKKQRQSVVSSAKFNSDPLLPSPLSNLPPSIKLRILHLAAQQDDHFRLRAKAYEGREGLYLRQAKQYGTTLLSLSLVNKEFASLAQSILFKEIKRLDKCGYPIFTFGIAHCYGQHVKAADLSVTERRSYRHNDPPNTPDSLLSFLPLFVNLSSITIDRKLLAQIFPSLNTPDTAARRRCLASIGNQITTVRVKGMSHKESPILDDFPRLKHLELVDLPLVKEEATTPSHSGLDAFVASYQDDPETAEQKSAKAKEQERRRVLEEEKEKVETAKREIEERALLDAIVSKKDLELLEVRQTQTRKKVVHHYGPPYPVTPTQTPVLPLNWIHSTWPQLKQISLTGPQIGQRDLDFVAMFKDSLETLVIRTMHQNPITETPSLPHLPHLHSLTIATPHPIELCRFLRLSPPTEADGDTPIIEDPLHYPLLTSLSLDGVPDFSAFEPVLSFILSHSSTLRSLDCFEPSDPLNSSSIASFLCHPSLSNVHIHTSAYPANSFPLDAFNVARPASDDEDGPINEAEPVLREPTVAELEEMIDKALSYGERRIEEATKSFQEDGSQVKELFAFAGLYKNLDLERVAKFA